MERDQAWWDEWMLRQASSVASASKDPSTKVGAVITEGKRLIAMGYNGFPSRIADDDRLNVRDVKYDIIIHAEMNALLFAQRDITGMTLYTYPVLPCSRCASMYIQAGIARVVAPKPSAEFEFRWGTSLALARSLFDEAGVELLEYPDAGA